MALVSLRQVLDHAAEFGYGVPAFNVNNLEQIQAIMEADQETQSPVTRSSRMRSAIGVPVGEIRRGIASGVRKINIDTDIRLAMTGAMRKVFAEQPSEFDPRKALIEARKPARGIVKARFEAFGCAGHAAKIKPVSLDAMALRYH